MIDTKKKILYVITKSNWGGAQRYVFDLATNLPKEGFEVTVACGGTGPLTDRLGTSGIRVLNVKNFVRDVSLLRDARTFFELVSLFRRERPDIVHLNSAKAVVLGALAARIARVPRIVATAHGWASREPRPMWQRTCIRVAEWFGTLCTHTTIVVCTGDVRGGTILVHNGIEQPRYLPREEARKVLDLPRDGFVVGTVAELNKNKNVAVLIDAYIQAHIPHATLAILGNGDERTSLEARSKAHQGCDIRLLGFRQGVAGGALMNAFDVFVLPSQKEGLPYVLLEAGYARLPVVASNVGGIPDIITHEKSGLLYMPNNVEGFADALRKLAPSPELRTTLGKALHEKVSTSFSFTHMLTSTLSLYTK